MFAKIYENWTVLEKDRATITKSKFRDYLEYNAKYIPKIIENTDKFETAIDIGACYGFWSYLLKDHFKKINAFELVWDHRECFRRNMITHGIDNVTLFDYGLGDKKTNCSVGILNVFAEKYGYAAYNAHVMEENTNGLEKLSTLDNFNFKNVNFIKIDAEGYELKILEGAINTLKKFKPVLFIETKDNYNGIESFLRNNFNYRVIHSFKEDTLFKA